MMCKKILLLVTGMSPQIVTETIYGLAVKPDAGKQPWVPDEVHVISTTSGLTQIRATLFPTDKDPGYFAKLRADYNLPPILFDESCLHPILDSADQPLNDLKTPQDNELAANTICNYVRDYTANPDTELHVSIAGGRKTMGFYAGYALSLYGRPQDRMSHVLISNEYESSRDFFYPAPQPNTVFATQNFKNERLDAYDAEVWLADIPFVRLRSSLDKHAMVDKATFSEVVEAINAAQQPLHVKINTAEGKTIWVNETQITLPPREFAFYAAFLADRVGEDLGITRPTNSIRSDDDALLHQYYTGPQMIFDCDLFDELKSKIKKIFSDELGPDLSERLCPHQQKKRSPYRLSLSAEQISFSNPQ